jgi:ribose transport system ATP-binding protein
MPSALLEVNDLSKTFEGNRVLRDVSLSVEGGEVHGLLGQNGSGKSTLIKILAGYHRADSGGSILAMGHKLSRAIDARVLQRLGWVFVHQDLGLIDSLSVMDNFHLAGLGSMDRPLIRPRRDKAFVREALDRFGTEVDASSQVRDLTGVQRAMVAVVRAAELIGLSTGHRSGGGLLVLDEPTVYLTDDEVDQLFALIRRVTDAGAGVLLVSHRLREIRDITETVTVLRDGSVSLEGTTSSVSEEEMVNAIVGHAVERGVQKREQRGGVLSRASGISSETLRGVSFDVHGGEVLGVTGVAGSGFEDLPYLLFGARAAKSGYLEVSGRRLKLAELDPWKAMELKVALIPGNRLRQGAVGDLSVSHNTTLPTIQRYYVRGRLDNAAQVRRVGKLAMTYNIQPRDPTRLFAHLSGGNQQKAIVGKWLETEPTMVLIHEPTQGLDVGAREQVIAELRSQAETGRAIVCATSDWSQLQDLCDRVLVLKQGRIVGELRGSAATPAEIGRLSL